MIFQLVPLHVDEMFHVLVPEHSYLTSHDIVLFGTKVSSTFYPGPGLPPPFRSALFVVISEERLSSSSSSPSLSFVLPPDGRHLSLLNSDVFMSSHVTG